MGHYDHGVPSRIDQRSATFKVLSPLTRRCSGGRRRIKDQQPATNTSVARTSPLRRSHSSSTIALQWYPPLGVPSRPASSAPVTPPSDTVGEPVMKMASV